MNLHSSKNCCSYFCDIKLFIKTDFSIFTPLGKYNTTLSDGQYIFYDMCTIRMHCKMIKETAIEIAVFEWYTQADLNRQPSESESDALSSCAMGAC